MIDADTVLPTNVGKFFIIGSSIVGSFFSFLFGDVQLFLGWLLILMTCDFLTGWASAFATGTWSSHKNFLGICKKMFVLMMVSLSHGMDVIFSEYLGVSFIQPIVICAYAAGEFGSIIENLEYGGFGSCVPNVLKKMIENVNQNIDQKAENVIKK